MARILAVDDERAILDALARVLGRDGHEVVKAADPTAVPGMDLSRFALVLCDVMMPGLDGFELVRQIRPDFDGPIVFLTARVAAEDAGAGYGLGADDYISKPFRLRELMARIKTVLRRSKGAATEEIRISGLTVRMKEGKVLKNGQEVILTALEYKLLLTFLQNRGRVLSRNMLLESIGDVAGDFVSDNTLSVYIKRLREKIEDDPVEPQIIKTVRGMGYKVDE